MARSDSAALFALPDQAALAALFALLEARGSAEYGGEGVTQLQHALQCAALADAAGASAALITAALLHDVGHLAHDLGEDATQRGVDDHHEARGAGLLRQAGLSEAVWRPVALHVEAKRWLVANDVGYAAQLSEESQRSLALQGGPMGREESARFLAQLFAQDAIVLRRWDDLAKDPSAEPASLAHWQSRLGARPIAAPTTRGESP